MAGGNITSVYRCCHHVPLNPRKPPENYLKKRGPKATGIELTSPARCYNGRKNPSLKIKTTHSGQKLSKEVKILHEESYEISPERM